MRFVRPRSPPRILTADLGVFKRCARNSTSASFARFSTAGACKRIFKAPSITPTISSLLARGCTRTGNETVPAAMFSDISGNTLLLPSSFILHRRLDLHIQCLRRTPRPIRITEQLPREKNQVRLLGCQNCLRLRGLADHPDGSGRDPSLFTNRFGKSGLIPRSHRNLHAGHRSSTRYVNQIHTERLQLLRQRDSLRQIPAALFPIRRRHPDEKGQPLWPRFLYRSNDLFHNVNSIF